MTRTLGAALASACILALAAPAAATSRIKDLANFERVRQNHLIGYGLVVGLNGTGPARYDRNPAWTIKAAGAIHGCRSQGHGARAGHRLRGSASG